MVMILRKRPPPPPSRYSPELQSDSEPETHLRNKKVSKPGKRKRRFSYNSDSEEVDSEEVDSGYDSEDKENEDPIEHEKISPEPEPEPETHLRNKKVSKPSKRKRRFSYNSDSEEVDSEGADSEEYDSEEKENEDSIKYEKIREQRIRENRERMEKLGIFSLSSDVFKNGNKKGNVRRKNATVKRKRYPPIYPRSRRSDRLKNVAKAHYIEKEGSLSEMGIAIPDQWKKEVYTEEDEKLLGDCKEKWELETDGFEEDGERVYNPFGTPCHQCRQKIMGKLTFCGKCRSPHGQFCGDCLYIRYGENVLEASSNPDWSCPVCRDICNCSRCRRTKGWEPINIPYSKIISSGFKSVAHYLILTRRAGVTPEELTLEEPEKPQEHEGSDYSAESSESDSDDSDSEDDSKGLKKKEHSVEMQFNPTVGSNEAALAVGPNFLGTTVQNVQAFVSCN